MALGAPPPPLSELVRVQDRMSFLYLERSVIHRESNAITATDERGTMHIPAASLGALLLGPGTTVSHQAMLLMAESGSTVVWVGERGVRYYAHGRSLTTGCACWTRRHAWSRIGSRVLEWRGTCMRCVSRARMYRARICSSCAGARGRACANSIASMPIAPGCPGMAAIMMWPILVPEMP